MVPNEYEIVVEVSIRQIAGPGYLQIRESNQVPVESFMEAASVLGKFHELMKEIKDKTK